MLRIMSFLDIAEVRVDPSCTRVYEEGWQSWSPVRIYPASAISPRPSGSQAATMGWRAGKPAPPTGFQGEGLLAIAGPAGVRAWYASDAAREVPRSAPASMETPSSSLVMVQRSRSRRSPSMRHLPASAMRSRRRIPVAWSRGAGACTWYRYFGHVTAPDVIENLDAADRLDLPLEVIQLDDGYEPVVGDWLDHRRGSARSRTSSLQSPLATAHLDFGQRRSSSAARVASRASIPTGLSVVQTLARTGGGSCTCWT